MNKKTLMALLLALALLLTGCAQPDPEADRATEIIRVGDTVYTKGNIQDQVAFQLAYMSRVYEDNGVSIDLNDPAVVADVQEQIITALVEDAVKNAKVKELGLDVLDESEQAAVTEAVEKAWQANLDSVKQAYFATSELTGADLDAAVEAKAGELGIVKANLQSAQETIARQKKLYDYVVKDVVVTDEELQADLDAKAAKAKADYEKDLSAYGRFVNNGLAVYYRPAGYRMIKQILVPFAEEDMAVIMSLDNNIATLQSEMSMLATALQDAMVDVDAAMAEIKVQVIRPENLADIPEVQVETSFSQTYHPTVEAYLIQLAKDNALAGYYRALAEHARDNAYAAIADRADLVMARLASGEEWDVVMAEESADESEVALTGYAICEGFTNADEEIIAVAMDLKGVGSVSPKTKGAYGYYIIRYDAEVQEGPVALDEVRSNLTNNRLGDKQEQAFAAQMEIWIAEANVKIDRDALNRK